LNDPLWLVPAVFLARVCDVSLGTVRTILVFRGLKYLAALIGFVEILIWVLAVSQVLQHLDAWYLAVAYAAGFAAGNVVGIHLEAKLAIGSELVRAVSESREVSLAGGLRRRGYSVTVLPGEGNEGPVEVVLVVEKRRLMPQLLRTIDELDPDAYYTITDVKDHASQYRRMLASVPVEARPALPKRK